MADVDVGLGLSIFLRSRRQVALMVGTRIYPDAAPQTVENCQLGEYITYSLVSYDPSDDVSGGIGFAQTTIQVNCYSNTKTRAEQLRGRVKDAALGFRGKMGTVTVRGCSIAGKTDNYLPPVQGQTIGNYARAVDLLLSHLE